MTDQLRVLPEAVQDGMIRLLNGMPATKYLKIRDAAWAALSTKSQKVLLEATESLRTRNVSPEDLVRLDDNYLKLSDRPAAYISLGVVTLYNLHFASELVSIDWRRKKLGRAWDCSWL